MVKFQSIGSALV